MANNLSSEATGNIAKQANVNPEHINAFKKLRQLARQYQKYKRQADLDELLEFTNSMEQGGKVAIANLLAFDRISQSVDETLQITSLKAKSDTRETSFRAQKTEDNFADLFGELYKKCGRDKEKFLEMIQEVNTDFLDSKTRTSHPTIFDHKFMWSLHAELANEIETAENAGELQPEIAKKLTEAMQKVFSGSEDVTQMKKITVLEENEIDVHNLTILKKINEVVREKYNAALKNFVSKIAPEDDVEPLGLNKDQFELRTWGCAFDADGRPRSTTLMLFAGINVLKELGEIKGDLRQNSNAHTLTLSAIIQARYRDSKFGANKFHSFCEEFVDGLNHQEDSVWKSPSQSPYIMLNGHKAAFAREMLGSDFQLVPDFTYASVMPVCEAFSDELEIFLQENNLDSKTTLEQLCSIRDTEKHENSEDSYTFMIDKFRDRVKARTVAIAMPDGRVLNKNFILDDGLHFIPDGETKISKSLKHTHCWANDEKTEIRENTHEERAILADSFKRLVLINETLKTNPEICDRLQIANFADEAHFYETLILMREAKLVEIKNGVVLSKPRIGFQPLLETVEDLETSKKVFTNLLRDPLVLSYYQQRGVGEFMFGFSDGAKSGGSLKSQRAICNASKELTELFESHGIKTRFFLGRGAGKDRGGMNEMGLSSYMLHDSYAKNAISDQTIQSDQPLAMTVRQKTEGEVQITSGVEHLVKTSLLSRLDENKSPSEKEQAIEGAVDWIADRSDEIFQEFIRKNPMIASLLNELPYNTDISSRPPKRGGGVPGYEDLRAIPVEYKPALIGLALHNYGLKQALNEFLGTELANEVSLKDLMQDKFFNNFIRVQERHLDNFDPEMAKAILHVDENNPSDRDNYILQMIDGTIGLKETLSFMTGNFHRGGARTNPVTESGVNRVAAQAIMASLPAGTDTNQEHHGKDAQILRIVQAVSAAGFRDDNELIANKDSNLALAA